MGRAVQVAVIAAVASAGYSAAAAPCPTTVALTGDPKLVASVTDLLVAHGVAMHGPDFDGCRPTRVLVTPSGTAIVVTRAGAAEDERAVSDATTAATVIESWSSDYVALDVAVPASPGPAVTSGPPSPTAALARSAPPAPGSPQGVHVFAAMESSFANDRTSWLGAVAGVALPLGRMWLSARGRISTVVDGPATWNSQRRAEDVLFGGEVPFGYGRSMLWLGFGAGAGAVHTADATADLMGGNETFGLRADAHLTWSVRLVGQLSLELSAALDAAQVTDIEGSLSDTGRHEPGLFGRLGAGLRLGRW